MDIKLPGGAAFIIDTLLNKGFEAYIVGGCVRDSLIGKVPEDWDICTDARPVEVMEVFSPICPVIPTGIKHGTVTLILDERQYEVTTYRIEGNYSDGRRPDNVSFTGSLTEDLSRRDFTINAMAYNEIWGLVDPFGGFADLNNKLITCVGSADARMKEDYLRALRAIRFECQLGFSIHEDTIKAILNNNILIKNISMERIRDELVKILLSPRPGNGIKLLDRTGLLENIIPELFHCFDTDTYHFNDIKSVLNHIIAVLDNTPGDLIIRLAALIHHAGSEHLNPQEKCDKYSKILRMLKFDVKTINRVGTLAEGLWSTPDLSDSDIKKFISRVGDENLNALLELKTAHASSIPNNNEDFDYIIKLKQKCSRIISEHQPLTIKDLDIDGHDLIKLGFWPGKEIGLVLNNLLEAVLENPELNKHHLLKDMAKKYL